MREYMFYNCGHMSGSKRSPDMIISAFDTQKSSLKRRATRRGLGREKSGETEREERERKGERAKGGGAKREWRGQRRERGHRESRRPPGPDEQGILGSGHAPAKCPVGNAHWIRIYPHIPPYIQYLNMETNMKSKNVHISSPRPLLKIRIGQNDS